MFVSKQLKKERMDICLSCENYGEKFAIKGLCLKCYCLVKLKTELSVAKCPISKW
jgi:hypothetical protein